MIIFGTRTIQISRETIPLNCSHCDTADGLQMIVFQKYAHVFWIPFFPIQKIKVTECTHCKQVLRYKEFPDDYKNLQSSAKTPIWIFTGIALLAVLITLIVIIEKENHKRNSQLISVLQKGDIFEIKKTPNQYTLFKVDHIAGDTVFILMSQYETNTPKGLVDIKNKGDEAFILHPMPMLKSELKNMFEKGVLTDIDRN